jgi:hypothetical protein
VATNDDHVESVEQFNVDRPDHAGASASGRRRFYGVWLDNWRRTGLWVVLARVVIIVARVVIIVARVVTFLGHIGARLKHCERKSLRRGSLRLLISVGSSRGGLSRG